MSLSNGCSFITRHTYLRTILSVVCPNTGAWGRHRWSAQLVLMLHFEKQRVANCQPKSCIVCIYIVVNSFSSSGKISKRLTTIHNTFQLSSSLMELLAIHCDCSGPNVITAGSRSRNVMVWHLVCKHEYFFKSSRCPALPQAIIIIADLGSSQDLCLLLRMPSRAM